MASTVIGGPQFSEHRWMAFVDGENLTLRAQKPGLVLKTGKYYQQDCFVWVADTPGTKLITSGRVPMRTFADRAHYYTSFTGDELGLKETREKLWKLGFSPQVFKK